MPVTIDPMKVAYVKEFYEKGLSEGRSEGEIKGRSEGRSEGQIALLQKALEVRFGTLTPAVKERIRKATEAELERWTLRLVTGGRLDEIFS